jgi:hypothetical protein
MSEEKDNIHERLDIVRDLALILSLDPETTKRRNQFEDEQQEQISQKYGRRLIAFAFVILVGAVAFGLFNSPDPGWWADTVSNILFNLFTELLIAGILVGALERFQEKQEKARRQREARIENMQLKALQMSPERLQRVYDALSK